VHVQGIYTSQATVDYSVYAYSVEWRCLFFFTSTIIAFGDNFAEMADILMQLFISLNNSGLNYG
jgi:hypothetical protein